MFSNKVSLGTLSGLVTTTITGLLVQYVPAFHSGLPQPVHTLVAALVGAAGFAGAGYAAKHRPTVAEIEREFGDAEKLLELVKPVIRPYGGPVTAGDVEKAKKIASNLTPDLGAAGVPLKMG